MHEAKRNELEKQKEKIDADIAKISANEVEFYAYCALDERVPLILGFKDLLETFAIHFDIRSGVAYLEE